MRRLPLALLAVASPAYAQFGRPILGGTQTHVGDFPSVVVIETGQDLCTGTLLTRDWVLTAAHCVTPGVVLPGGTQAQLTASIRVHFGTVNLSQSAGTIVTASDSIPDPVFDINALGQGDSGLIKLSTPVTNVTPVPINLDATESPVGISVVQVGFGATQAGVPPGGTVGIEYRVDKTSVSCSILGGSDANLLCFNEADGTGKCEGDSGGPSFAMINGKQVQIGITSFGDRGCQQYGADTRTDAEKAFILQHVPNVPGSCTQDSDCPNMGECFQTACIAQPFGAMGLGSTCTSGTDCQSMACASGPGGMKCTMSCTVGSAGTCPNGFDCDGTNGTNGACWPAGNGGGCCDTSGRGAPTMVLGIALVGLVLRRRRYDRKSSSHLSVALTDR
jgi:hypothetical protein